MVALDEQWDKEFGQVLWEDGGRRFCRLREEEAQAERYAYMSARTADGAALLLGERRLEQEYALREYLDAAWALRPVDLVRRHGRATMVVEFSGGVRLDRLIGRGFSMGQFLRLAMSMVAGLGQLHSRGIIHKDIKPANLVADLETARVWYTGFGIASRLTRERHPPEPPELIAGTLAYMAPEQTGRVNRSIDSRSDLYSLGVSFYEMLTGQLPFAASDPMEWVHCHIARQPMTPHERDAAIPPALSAIVMKLLAKTVEERYQTAKGIESDLARCLAAWEAQGSIAPFELALSDTPDRLMIPEKLYGRDREIATLLAAFERIVTGGRTELVLVSGYSGIGKSAVVNELHKPLVPPRGLFASGKFDQYKRDIPYATLAQAFQSLIRPLLSANEASLQQWRAVLQAAVEPNGLLMVDLVPELGHIIGEQPAVPALPPKEAKRRFQLVFRRFIAAFARPEHPLALFLDDLQWLDSATLDLLEDLLVSDDLQHLLLIGAYRDNEVSPTHPLLLKLEAIRCTGAPVHDIVLEPLACEDLGQLLGDTLRCGLAQAVPLAALIHAKTTGNPFFSIQFIGALADEGLLVFDYDLGRWVWDLERILAKNFTDNVVELMVAKLRRLAPKTQLALRQFACMGNTASFDMLGMAYQGGSVQDMHRRLGEAVRSGLVFRAEDSYRFLHDRVQEASYSQIPPSERAEAHLRIGLLLAAHTPSAKLEEAVFEIVNQLNRGAHLLRADAELVQVAQLNLIAGRRAKNATAYDSALKYLRVGSAFLPESAWANHYALFFSIEFLIAECELMTMDMVAAEARLARLVVRAANRHDACLVTRLRLTLYTAMDQSDRGVDVFLDWLRQDGTAWSGHPTRADAMREYERIWTLLGARTIEELVDLPLSNDTDYIDTMEVFSEIVTPALFYDEHLFSLTLCRMVNLSLEHGNCDGSCFGYAWFAMAAGPQFDNYRDGYRFGQLGFDLVETRGLTRYQARMYITFSNAVVPWVRHVASERDLLDRAFDLAYRAGDLTFAAYRGEQIVANYLLAGDYSLPDLEREAENGLAFGQRVGFGYVIHNCNSQLGLIRSLRALNGHFGKLDTERYTEAAAERDLASNPVLSLAEFCYWTRKLQARFFAGDFAAATDAAARAQSLIWSAPGQIVTADFRFYAALSYAAYWHQAGDGERPAIIAALNVHHHQLEVWALHCPANFAERTALVRAEIARLEARQLEAQTLYEEAILLAHENGSIHNEALANELAGRYYAERGFKKIALVYIRDSCLYYTRWGAEAKTRQLRHDFPALGLERSLAESATTINAPVEHLDLATVLRISEAVSGEMVLEKLIDTLMRSAVEHAGAERGLLILPFEGDYRIEAEVITSASQVQVQLRQSAIGAADLPQSVFRYALRTRDSVLLHDAMNASAFSDDDYVRERHARSVMCMPILKQSRLLGMLYLENNLAPSAFTPARIAILKLLASQAAVSMENARLYRDLAEREARIRRLVDADIIGIVITAVDGRIIEANDAFLRIVGYNRDEFVAQGVCWPKITPPEWLHLDEAFRMPELKLTGRLPPFEKEFFRKDGSRVPVLVGAASFEDESGQVVAFVLDLSERKRDAEALRALQMDLAYANRLATMGQLTASIAHEVNQPIGAMRNNAHAALRFLAASPPALADVGEALACVVDDTYRAHDIIKGIRDQVSKVPPRQDKVDLNEAIRNVIALVRGELSRHAISLQTQLAERLPPVHGDRIQLQQVVLNLIVNAIEAMAEGDRKGRILCVHSAMSRSGGVLVSVRDSGPGIAPEHHEQVFESFFTTKPGGVGIGLSICRTIIQAHGGKLWVDGDWPLGGAFDFTLPAVP